MRQDHVDEYDHDQGTALLVEADACEREEAIELERIMLGHAEGDPCYRSTARLAERLQ